MEDLKSTKVNVDVKKAWRKEEPESFEVTEYGKDKKEKFLDSLKVVKEIVRDISLRTPSHGFQATMGGPGLLKLSFHCYEMQLPRRLAEVEHQAKQLLDAAAKEIKKEFKERTGDTLTFREKKELANYTVEKVSLNERWMYVSWRCYELE